MLPTKDSTLHISRKFPSLNRIAGLVPSSLVVAVGLLVAVPAHAYRTGEDSPVLADRGRVAWGSLRIGFALNDSSLPTGVTKVQMEQALASSLDAWNAPECSVVDSYFAGWTSEAAAEKDGTNTISWVDDWTGRGFPTLSPGTTVMQYRGHDDIWEIADADIYLDATSYDWTTGGTKGTSLQAVLTHELGHALGLLHPCEPNGDDGAPDCERASDAEQATTMYPFYSAGQTSLDGDDAAGICYLYPPAQECGQGCPRGEMCVEGECRATCRDAVCERGEVCGYWDCAAPDSCLDRYCIGAACKTTSDCGPLARCVDGACASGPAAWGDACGESSDCAQGACVDAVCQPDCSNDSDCGSVGSCHPTLDGRALGCKASRAYESGLHCAEGEDCKSGICIFTANPSVCTNECKTSDQCPERWSCGNVEGQQVCVPPTIRASGGCSITPNSFGRKADWILPLFCASGVALFGLRRRRARASAG